MRRFVSLVVLLLFAIPFGVSISGCSKTVAPTFCNGGDSGITTGQITNLALGPISYGISLNYGQIGQILPPVATDCKGSNVPGAAFTYGTTDMTIADVEPSNGRLCAGSWNRNSGGGIPDFTYCTSTNKTGTAYVTASSNGVTSNSLPVYIHPVVTGIVLGSPSPGGAASISAWSIVNNGNVPTVTFTAQNSFSAGQVLTLSNFPNSTFFNGITNATVLTAGLSSTQFAVTIPGFSKSNGSAIETGLAVGPGCSTNPSTDCCPLGINPVTAPAYQANSCLSQGATAQLVARVFAGTGASQSNISCQAGHPLYTVQSSNSANASQVVTIDQNGVATANQPGTVLISATISNAASSAGFFSTCPPKSITLSAPGALTPGTPASPVVLDQNNTQPLLATAVDTNGVALTGLALEYESTSPIEIPAGTGSIVPVLAGAASITAICQPPNCNPSPYNQIGLFGNGKPVTSNSVNFSTPGTNSTVLYMASTQSLYIATRDFTQAGTTPPYLLPYLPNSMVISNDGTNLYLGSSTALMVVSATSGLALTRSDATSPGSVLAVSPDGSQIVISDPVKGITTIQNSTGGIVTTYGGVGTRAEYTPDSQTVYIAAGNQILVYSSDTGWTSITPATNAATPVSDVAVTVPSVGAYFAGPNTTARSYCHSSTASTVGGVTTETNIFFPLADSPTAITDRLAATNDGMHIVGATVTPAPTLNDLRVDIPAGNVNGPSAVSIVCPTGTQTTSPNGTTNGTTGGLNFSSTVYPLALTPITATAITGVVPTSDSTLAVVTYAGSGGVLPAYKPSANGPGTITYIPLATVGTAAATAPLSAVVSSDNSTIYVGTQNDNLVHLINRNTLTDTSTPTTALSPGLVAAPGLTVPAGSMVPVNLMVQKPRKTT
jgi:hypothetical protein